MTRKAREILAVAFMFVGLDDTLDAGLGFEEFDKRQNPETVPLYKADEKRERKLARRRELVAKGAMKPVREKKT